MEQAVHPSGLLVAAGTATLAAGTIAVAGINALNSIILTSHRDLAGAPGQLQVPNATRLGTGFTVTSQNAGDTSTIDWVVIPLSARQSASGIKYQFGTATLVAGTIVVTGVTLTPSSVILLTRNTPGGVVGELSAPVATRLADRFTITSGNAADVSTVNWVIVDNFKGGASGYPMPLGTATINANAADPAGLSVLQQVGGAMNGVPMLTGRQYAPAGAVDMSAPTAGLGAATFHIDSVNVPNAGTIDFAIFY